MRKTLLAMVLLAMTLGAATARCEAANSVRNGDFEVGNAGEPAPGWASVLTSDQNPKSGKACGQRSKGYGRQDVTVLPNTTYQLDLDVRSVGEKWTVIEVISAATTQKVIDISKEGPFDWEHWKETYTTGPNETKLLIYLGSGAENYWDNISLIPLVSRPAVTALTQPPSSTCPVQNGDFEVGNAGEPAPGWAGVLTCDQNPKSGKACGQRSKGYGRQDVTVLPNTTYQLDLDVRSVGEKWTVIEIISAATTQKVIDISKEGPFDWEHWKETYTTGPNETKLLIYLGSGAENCWDNISLVPLTSGPATTALPRPALSTWPVQFNAAGLSFRRVVPFETVYGQTPASELPPLDELVIFACRNEFEAGTFAICPDRDIPDLKAKLQDLQNEGKAALPAALLDLRVVRVWDQWMGRRNAKKLTWEEAGKEYSPYLTPVPELLLTDDRTQPKVTWEKALDRDGKEVQVYTPPEFPSEFGTQLTGGQLKQLWLTVRVPEDQAAGLYKGAIEFSSRGRPLGALPVTLLVLPVPLQPPDFITGIYFTSTLETHYRQVSESRYRSQLQFLKNHGIEAITFGVTAWSYERLKRAYELVREVGLKGPIVQIEVPADDAELARRVALAKEYGYEPYFYGVDEVDLPNVAQHIWMSYRVKRAGGQVVTAIRTDFSDRLDAVQPLDWANFSHCYIPATKIKATYDGKPEERILGGFLKRHKIETQYWQCWYEDPLLNRFLAGFYLYRSGLDGFFVYCTDDFHLGDPYQYDWRLHPYAKEWTRCFNFYYPAQGDPIPTVESEALREAIDDLRYLRTVRKVCGEEAATKFVDILQPFSYYSFRRVHAEPPRPEDFHNARLSLVALLIDRLQAEMPADVHAQAARLVEKERPLSTRRRLPPYGAFRLCQSMGFTPSDTAIGPKQEAPCGNRAYLSIVNGSRVLVRFDVSTLPRPIRVRKATLRLFTESTGNDGDGLTVTATRASSEWDADEATWTMRRRGIPWNNPGGDCDAEPTDSQVVKGSYSEYAWDVTEAVRDWVRGTRPNYGIVLTAVKGTGTGEKLFLAAEYEGWQFADNRPELEVLYDTTTD